MRTWQIERRKRTRQLIALGGLAVKSGIVELTGDDRALIYGAMLWIGEKLKSEDGGRARELWAGKGKEAFRGCELQHRSEGLEPVGQLLHYSDM